MIYKICENENNVAHKVELKRNVLKAKAYPEEGTQFDLKRQLKGKTLSMRKLDETNVNYLLIEGNPSACAAVWKREHHSLLQKRQLEPD